MQAACGIEENQIIAVLAGKVDAVLCDLDRIALTFVKNALLVVLIGTVLGTLSMVDYYGTGVLTIFIFYFFRGRKWWCLAGQLLALYWVNVQLLGGLLYPVHIFGMEFEICQQGLALLALLPIWLYRGRQGYHSKPFQYACYAFYPVHMLILVLILQYLTR